MNAGDRFDCRRYVKPGDRVRFASMWCCDGIGEARRVDEGPRLGIAVSVHERFIFVRLKNVIECVNRWNICAVNGREVRNGCCKWV